ncbi:MAG TPA: hypothetical protein VMX35_03505 [Acidobacteriota bacterium]|nr:hypothetical protein [Acidobacteriota bacterium]
MSNRKALVTTVLISALAGFAAAFFVISLLQTPVAGVRAETSTADIAGLQIRIEALEAAVAGMNTEPLQESDRQLARIADNLRDASDRWLRDIAGSLNQISQELANIKRAIEAK